MRQATSVASRSPVKALGLVLVLAVGCRYNPSFSNTQCGTSAPRCPSGFVCDTGMSPAMCVSLTEEITSGGRGGTVTAASGGLGGGVGGQTASGGVGGATSGSGGAAGSGVAGGAGRSAASGAGGAAGTSGLIGTGGSSGGGGAASGGAGGSVKTGSGGIGSGGAGGPTGGGGGPAPVGSGGTVGSGGVGSGGSASGGATVPACSATDTRCMSSTDVQSCVAGQWGTITMCPNACVGTTCGGDCRPVTTRCSIDTPQTCDQTGTWRDAPTGACPTGLCSAGACLTVGNFGFTTGTAELLAPSNDLVAVQVQLPAGILVGLGAITTQTTGQHLIIGLYTDAAGSPSNLVKSSAQLTVVVGTNEAAVTHAPITAGTYWLVEVSDATTHFASSGQSITLGLRSYTFGALPMAIAGALMPANGNAPDLYARVAH